MLKSTVMLKNVMLIHEMNATSYGVENEKKIENLFKIG